MKFTAAAFILALANAAHVHGQCAVTLDQAGAVVVPNDWTEIETLAFHGCPTIKSVVIPTRIVTIRSFAFNGLSLEVIEFEAGSQLKTIGKEAFQGTNIKKIIIPQTVEAIGYAAFAYSSLLEVVEFKTGSQLQSIGEDAFRDTALVTINVPKDVLLGLDVFKNTQCPDKFQAGKHVVDCAIVAAPSTPPTTISSKTPTGRPSGSPSKTSTGQLTSAPSSATSTNKKSKAPKTKKMTEKKDKKSKKSKAKKASQVKKQK